MLENEKKANEKAEKVKDGNLRKLTQVEKTINSIPPKKRGRKPKEKTTGEEPKERQVDVTKSRAFREKKIIFNPQVLDSTEIGNGIQDNGKRIRKKPDFFKAT